MNTRAILVIFQFLYLLLSLARFGQMLLHSPVNSPDDGCWAETSSINRIWTNRIWCQVLCRRAVNLVLGAWATFIWEMNWRPHVSELGSWLTCIFHLLHTPKYRTRGIVLYYILVYCASRSMTKTASINQETHLFWANIRHVRVQTYSNSRFHLSPKCTLFVSFYVFLFFTLKFVCITNIQQRMIVLLTRTIPNKSEFRWA